jgi:DNA-binding transcriptional LysR family regulator
METGQRFQNPSYDIRLKDIELLIELFHIKSVRELARKCGTSPGQMSKLIKSLELKLGFRLLNRSSYGVEPTAEAKNILGLLEQMHELHFQIAGHRRKESKENLLSFSSTSFLSTHLLPSVFSSFTKKSPEARFRLVDLPPNQFTSVGLRGGFQLCVHLNELDWPKTWTSIEVGTITWDLYCRAHHPVLKDQGDVLDYPFVYPVYWSDEGVQFGNDNCPINIRKRRRGHETSTALAAAELVRLTDNLGYLPNLLTKTLLERGQLCRISVKSWKGKTQTVYLTVKNDFVKQHTFLQIKDLLQKELTELARSQDELEVTPRH